MTCGCRVWSRTVSPSGVNLPGLLCMLAFTPGRAVANERLIGALWPDVDPVRGRRSLTSLVHQLNLIIDPVLGTTRTMRTVKGVGRTLRVDPSSIDAVQFERGVAAGEAHASAGRHESAVDELMETMTLWRGQPFGGLHLPSLVEPAAQLATTRARAVSILVDSALRIGQGHLLLDLLEPKVDAHPEDEQMVGSLARALYQVGRHDRRVERHRAVHPTALPPWHRTHTDPESSRRRDRLAHLGRT